MSNLVTIETYKTRIEAEVDKSFLNANNISCTVSGDDAGGAYNFPFSYSPTGIELKVDKKDCEKAQKLLNR